MSSLLTEGERAYLAGFFDGEGCVYIAYYKQSRRWTKVHRLDVIIVQANEPYLERWRQKTGLGNIYRMRGDIYHWRCSGGQAEALLELIYPYLIIKKEQARIGLEFRRTKGEENLGGHYKHSHSLVRRREEMRLKLMQIKQEFKTTVVEEMELEEYDPCPSQMRLAL